MVKFKIDVYSHGVRIRIHYPNEREAILRYCERLAIYESVWVPKLKRRVRRAKAVFATATHDRKEFGFLKAEFTKVEEYLKGLGYKDSDFQYTYHEPIEGVPIEIALQKGVGPRDDGQVRALEFMRNAEAKNRILNLPTGYGKTACGLITTAHYKVRTAFVMASGHFKTWIDSTKWVLDIDHSKDICVVQGREHLVRLVRLSLAGQNDYKLIFISIATIRAFLKDYLAEGYTVEGVSPYELFPTLGVGMRIVDESHENIHALVTATTFTHVRRAIYLSATLVSEDEKINSQYLKIFPMEDRFKDVTENDHAKCVSVTYRLEHPDKVKCTGTKGYSHVAYEQWLMANRIAESRYYEFIESLVEAKFVSEYQDEQKLLIFCATTEMCERLASRLSKLYPQFKTSAYTASYAAEVLYSNDIIVSTPTSAGTGKDIPNLKTCISTVAIGSVQRNLQMLGRLRPIKKYPNIAPTYYWLTCLDIQQHREYDARKREQFAGKCASIEDMPTNVVV